MLHRRRVLFIGRSEFGRYKVMDTMYDGRLARVLYGDRGSPQSGVALDDDPELLFDYNQRFLEMIQSHDPRKILVIGGGAFMLPMAAFYQFPKAQIDVVEIDPLLVQLAHDFFEVPDDPRLRIFVEDGLNYIHNTDEQYDMIILDAFSGYTIPHHLLERDAILAYKKQLKKNGVVTANFISEYKPSRRRLAHELVASFGEVFPVISLYQSDVDYPKGAEQNLLLVASRESVHFPYLQSEELDLLH